MLRCLIGYGRQYGLLTYDEGLAISNHIELLNTSSRRELRVRDFARKVRAGIKI